MSAAARRARTKIVRARVSDDLGMKIEALAIMRADEENESLVLREALTWYVAQPAVKELLEEGLKRLAAKKVAAVSRLKAKARDATGSTADDSAGKQGVDEG